MRFSDEGCLEHSTMRAGLGVGQQGMGEGSAGGKEPLRRGVS